MFGVLTSTQLAVLVSFEAKNKSTKKMLNSSGPETPNITTYHVL